MSGLNLPGRYAGAIPAPFRRHSGAILKHIDRVRVPSSSRTKAVLERSIPIMHLHIHLSAQVEQTWSTIGSSLMAALLTFSSALAEHAASFSAADSAA